jgi:hypothetical protein
MGVLILETLCPTQSVGSPNGGTHKPYRMFSETLMTALKTANPTMFFSASFFVIWNLESSRKTICYDGVGGGGGGGDDVDDDNDIMLSRPVVLNLCQTAAR